MTTPTQQLAMLTCTGCGAGVPIARDQQAASCAFCGTSSPVDPAKVAWQQAMPQLAADTEREGLDALRGALIRKLEPSAASKWGLAGMAVAVTFAVPIALQLMMGKGSHVIVSLLAMAVLTTVTTLSILGRLKSKAPALAEAEMSNAHSQVTREPGKGSCPECGAQVQVPPHTASLDCAFCHSPLVAAEGMLIKWVEDAQARRAAWGAQAAAIVERLDLASRRAGWVGGPLVYLTPIGAAAAVIFAINGMRSLGWIEVAGAGEKLIGERVEGANGEGDGKIVDVYGKFAKVHWDREVKGKTLVEWVLIEEGIRDRKRPAIDPEEEARFDEGAEVTCPSAYDAEPWDGKVVETYGALVRVEHRVAGAWWAHGDDCTKISKGKASEPAAPKKPRRGRRRGR